MHVSALTFVFIFITLIISVALPIVGFIIYKKKGADILPFFVGCAVMLVFALIIESIFHQIVLVLSPVGSTIQNNIWLYATYGGFMAGLFEETGRFLAFKTVLKNKLHNDTNGLMYGAGHGGFEAIVLMGSTCINNIVYSVLINANQLETITKALPEDMVDQFMAQIAPLYEGPAYTFLLAGYERILAIILQISISVIVWFAVKNKKTYMYPVAILLHALVDGILIVVLHYTNLIVAEAAITVLTALLAAFAVNFWKRNHKENK